MGMGRGTPKYPINNFNKTNLSYPFEMFHNTLSKLRCTVFLNLKAEILYSDILRCHRHQYSRNEEEASDSFSVANYIIFLYKSALP